ncbi:hypothetical protein AB0F81_11595 [Actinoplanes sp. NPDC024001]|uniref:hypothetical protein n=1 Tax=Actinoplanes sp. NPDC024001 TaxID=3154598 RepID=UPI0033F77766
MGSDAQDDQPRHQEDQNEATKQRLPDELWQIALGVAELGALYFSHKGNEGAAHSAQALALVIQVLRPKR